MGSYPARGIGLLQITRVIKGAGTIRVVFAAKLLKKLISIRLAYLVYLVLKLLPVPVPARSLYCESCSVHWTDEFFRWHTQLQSCRLHVNTKYLSRRRGAANSGRAVSRSRRSTGTGTQFGCPFMCPKSDKSQISPRPRLTNSWKTSLSPSPPH